MRSSVTYTYIQYVIYDINRTSVIRLSERLGMATIRYLAAISKNPAELTSFYIDEIGMQEWEQIA